MKDRSALRADAAALAGLALAVVAVFFDPLFLDRTFFRRDMGVYFLPIEAEIHRAWASGRLPLWWDGVSGGRPLLPNPNAGVFYPLRLAGALVPFALYFKLFPIVHLILAAWGMYLLVRRFRCTRMAAFAASSILVFSAPVMSEVLFMILLPGLALLVWSWWALIRIGEQPTRRRALPLALIFASGALGADPFAWILTLLVCLLWVSLELPRSSRGAALRRLAECGAVALLIAGIQIIPSFLYVGETDRALGGMKARQSFLWSLHPARLLEWFVPFPFGDTRRLLAATTWGGRLFDGRSSGFFPSLFAGTLATIGLIEARKSLRVARTPLLLILLSVLLASIPVLLPSRLALSATPVPLRYPEKFAIGATVGLAVLAALTWDRRVGSGSVPRWPLGVALGLGLLSVLVRAFREPLAASLAAATHASADVLPALRQRLPSVFTEAALHWAAGFGAVALLARFGGRRWAWAGAFALCAADLLTASRGAAASSDGRLASVPPPAVAALNRMDPERRYSLFNLNDYLQRPAPSPLRESVAAQGARTDFESWLALSNVSGAFWGRPLMFNTDPDWSDLYRMGALRRLFFWQLARDPERDRRLAPFVAALSARYFLRYRDDAPYPGTAVAAMAGPLAIDEAAGAVPRVRLATRWVEVVDGSAAWARLLSADDPPELAIVETGRDAAGSSAPGTARILSAEPSRLAIKTDAPLGSWLVVARQFWRWREVRIDGNPASCVPARFALSAVAVPAGIHRVEWEEIVPGGTAGAALTAAGLLLLILFARRAR